MNTPIPFSNGSAAARAHYATALHQLHSYVGDPIATIDAALADSPDFVAGHLFKGLALATMAERQFSPVIAGALDAACRHGKHANARERGLMAATQSMVDGDWHAACRALDAVLVDFPRDALALQVGHIYDFARGDALNLRNRVARVLPHWNADVPGYSFVLGMHAFGLEEMNEYGAAEDTARAALAIEPRDGWAVHAATHVMEMQGRIDEGIAWLTSREADWAPDNGFAFHNWWHLALFHLDRGDHARVLALYDGAIHPGPAPLLLVLVDATALLWRLKLEGVDLGRRFEDVADEWEAKLDGEGGFYAFNDLHAAFAFAATGRAGALAKLERAMAQAAAREDTNAQMTREVGASLVRAAGAFGRGRWDEAVDAILPVRDIANRFGGSHAQRDILSLTLIEAARRAGRGSLAKHVLAERLTSKPEAQWGQRILARIDGAQVAVH